MKDNKEMKEKLEKLKNNNKIVVGVEQNRNDKNKMELVNVWECEKTNILQLLAFLYQKTILKNNNIKIKYSYNYSDLQTITFSQNYENYDGTITKTKYTFYNIPTNLCYIDIFKIEKGVFENEL